jgi:protein ImuB
VRTLALWCPDWPVTAWGATPRDPVAVLEAGRVAACSAAAREAGVAIGLRRREAESRCPGLALFEREPPREARCFEPLVAAVAGITPGVEVVRPGLCVLGARGPARYFGGELALCSTVREVAAAALAQVMELELPLGATGIGAIGIGVADGIFGATLAARAGVIVPRSGTGAFLAPLPLSVLRRPELVDLLGRLGIDSLGAFAALDASTVLARFGPDAAVAHRLAAGREERPLRPSARAEELCARVELDPPADRVDRALFAARTCADDLVRQLEERGLACLALSIEAMTEHGEELVRTWRGEEELGVDGMVERLRWQLEGWLTGTAANAPSGGIELVRLRADEVVRRGGRQLGLWGEVSEADRRATRGLDRLRGMLGPEAVFLGRLSGGRAPGDRVRLVPWGEESAAEPGDAPPWPGRHPQPAPALVYPEPLPAEVTCSRGESVRVSARGRLSAAPARLAVGRGPASEVLAWAGPWLSDERWWDRGERRRRARFQLLVADQRAYLCSVEESRWWVEATYD